MAPRERLNGVSGVIPAAKLRAFALAAGFDAVGFARAEPIDPRHLAQWLEAGHHAHLDWMTLKLAERLDISQLLPGAKTVIALASNYWRTDAPSPIARYARGRDYHATGRDRIRALRRAIRAEWPDTHDYASVDAGPVMEKVWAARAGLGFVGKNSCFITPELGSWVVLATMTLDAEVEAHAYAGGPTADQCGRCTLCITSCPTGAIVADQVVDAGLCLSYQTIENTDPVPEALRISMPNIVFGCDICQDVCPLNASPLLGPERFAPRAFSALSVTQLAAMTAEQYQQLVPGSPLARAGFNGLRRNAAYALGAMGATTLAVKQTLSQLASDPDAGVAEAAAWALTRL